ncbi:helix-turn-helix domain-containing protein [Paenibacillus sp. UMB4589-SE434]|uniref:helix-turn-helix domain-containing protein n=1 Tax=Paenibacillus sp. UMB4589-SE434 TaxID=3046314 RepID=UPI00254ECEC4|nr:helix-turn-helix domain-containing protein [Paenibacillus sp. UMB4589-SE434]MDK8179628.1 helix-turn-helix domain-containing protein [Paenibacillus sp. UMB4589-SE434]
MYVLRRAEVLKWKKDEKKMVFAVEFPMLLSCDHTVKIKWDWEWTTLQKGQVIFLRPGKSVNIVLESDLHTAQLFKVCFQSYTLIEDSGDKLTYNEEHSQLPAHGAMAVTGASSYRIFTMLEELTKEVITNNDSACDRHHYKLSELLRSFIQALKPAGEKVDPVIWKALEYINCHFDQQLTRSQLAKLVGFNTSYFSRLFHKQVGRSFSDHLTRVRVDKAKQHLLASNATLGEIAAKVGYADGLYLSRKFKQTVGMSPTEYRNLPKPKHVVAMQYAGDLLALGIQPIAAPFTPWEVSPLVHGDLEGTLDLEREDPAGNLYGLQVDMIVAPEYLYYWPGKMEKLEQLADVIVLPWNRGDRLEAVRLMGHIMGREKEADQWIEWYIGRARSAAAKLKTRIGPHETVGLYEVWEDRSICIWNATARGVFNLFEGLKLTPHPRIQREVLTPDNHLFIEESQLSAYAADHMFVVLPSESSDLYDSFTDKLTERPIWRELFADGRRRVYPLKLEEFWCNDAAALVRQLDIMANLMLNAADISIK